MIQILIHTPLWVYGLFVALLIFGIQQSFDRSISQVIAFLLPIGMVALSLAGVASSFGLDVFNIGYWFIGLILVTFLLFNMFPIRGVEFNADAKKYTITGSWVPLLVIMAIFFTKYAVGVMNSLNLPVANGAALQVGLCVLYGCYSGYFVSRSLGLFKLRMSAKTAY
ncbi:DUF6622 family protein [Colwelliaceae bacterium 6471]